MYRTSPFSSSHFFAEEAPLDYLYEKKGKIAVFTLNRPEQMNAKNLEIFRGIRECMLDFRDDPDLWVCIITGTGDKAFCAGADVKETLPYMREHRYDDSKSLSAGTIFRDLELWKPLIAAVNGVAYGGGCELALACDLRIASENARFAQLEMTVGAMPGGGGTQRWARYVPRCKAAEILLMGAVIDAREAHRIGLVNEVVPQEQLMSKAFEYAERICRLAPLAVRAAKEAMVRGSEMSFQDGLRLEKLLFEKISGTEDFLEGGKAFKEKRKPVFKGR
jgi:enoyl-CoA hydratase/carnithine racemase